MNTYFAFLVSNSEGCYILVIIFLNMNSKTAFELKMLRIVKCILN